MPRFSLIPFLICLLLAVAVLGAGSAAADKGGLPAHKEKSVCDANGHEAACHAKVVTELDGVSPLATVNYQNGYDPSDLASAYRWADPTGASWTGNAATVAIVDAYDNPNAYADLAAYRARFGLPPCTDSGCFRKVNQDGLTSPLPAADVGWGQEINLDIEMVSAVCPQCRILLVEASSNSLDDLGTAVNRAALMGATAISNSYGTTTEFSGETSYDSYYDHPNIAITASTGDNGYGVSFPAASNHVVAVGGTSLSADGSARGWSESAWSGAGSGCSAYFPKPSWQTDSGCARRTVADVSAVADPSTGVAVYDSYGSSGGANWYVFGGTSVSAPIMASVYALAHNDTNTDYPARLLYENPGGLFDAVGGGNSKRGCGAPYLCHALAGFDGPTGLGTPNGLGAFAATAPGPDFSVGISPSSKTVTVGTAAAYTLTVTPTNGWNASVGLSVSGLPAGATAAFAPASLSSGPSTLTVTTTRVAPGTSTLTITGTGTGGGVTHSVQATLVVQPVAVPDFSISVSPSSQRIAGTSTTTYTVTITPLNGFASPVTLTATPFAGLTSTFSTNPTTTNSTLTLKASRLKRHASYTVAITGTSGSLSHSTTLSITIQ